MSDAQPTAEGAGVQPTVRALMAGLFDYAGLFPPAGLGMAETVRNYLSYRRGPHAWMLGRLIVPWGRRDELLAALPAEGEPCPISMLLPLPSEPDARRRLRDEHAEFVEAAAGRVHVGAIETRVADAAGVAALGPAFDVLSELFPDAEVHAEATGSCDVEALLDALVEQRARSGRGAGKLRTGSVVPDEIPPVDQVVRFIRAAAARELPWKATAGLHHPLPAIRPLTYEADAPSGPMFGYLGVVLATARAQADSTAAAADLRPLLTEPGRPTLDAFSTTLVSAARTHGCLSIGSCSFVEPIEGATALSLLPHDSDPTR